MYPKKRRGCEVFSAKGQITIFIIIGIAVLFLFAAILYFTKTTVEDSLITETHSAQDVAPQAFKPLAAYTEDCLYQTARRGLILLGHQGGYLYPDIIGTFSAANPTDADGINLEPTTVPYWHYNKNPNTDPKISLASAQPKLHKKDDPQMSIESQLERYITEKIDSCLNNYPSFLQQSFEIFPAGEISSQVRIRPGSIVIQLDKPFEAALGDNRAEFSRFTVTVPLDLARYYELASGITESEKNYSFLEKQALDLIEVFSAVDANRLPPTIATTFELFATTSWPALQVEQDLRQMLVSYVPSLQLVSSANFYRYEYPVEDLSDLYQKTYDNMILPIPGAEELEVRFDYYDFPPYVRINSGQTQIKGDSLSVSYSVLNFATQQYKTVYDLSYPVLVSIYDPAAFDGEGYLFNFGLESNIRTNDIALDEQDLSAPSPPVYQRSLLCNENQRTTQPIRTLIVDSYTQEPLEAVQLAFSIPEQDSCVIGATTKDGVIEESYPAVYGGTMSLIKQDYLTEFYPIDTYKRQDNPSIFGYAVESLSEPVLEMHKVVAKNVTIKKKLIGKCIDFDGKLSLNIVRAGLGAGAAGAAGAAAGAGAAGGAAAAGGSYSGITLNEDSCFFSSLLGPSSTDALHSYRPKLLDASHYWVYLGAKQDLSSGERAVVTLKRIGGFNPRSYSREFLGAATLEGGQLSVEAELAPGIYEVNGFITSSTSYTIPKEERCSDGIMESIACLDVDGCCSTFPEQKIDQMMLGQLEWNTEPYYLTITPEMLNSAQEIEFYIPYLNIHQIPSKAHYRVIEDLTVLGLLSNISRDLRAQLEPSFK